MKKNLLMQIVLGLIWLFPITLLAQDVKLTISESSIKTMLDAMVASKYLSYGTVNDPSSTITYYSFQPTSIPLFDIQSNNHWRLQITGKASANFNVFFVPDYSKDDATLTLEGYAEVRPSGNGFKLSLILTTVTYGDGSWFDTIINSLSYGILPKHPEISTVIDGAFFTDIAPEYFTSAIPTLTTSENDLTIYLTLLAGPRFVTIQNDYSGNPSVGAIEHLENGSFASYNSPNTFEWITNSAHTVRANNGITNYNNQTWKFKSWSTNETSTQIDITADQDKTKAAKFATVAPVIIQTDLEGTANSGTIILGGQNKVSPYSDYLFTLNNYSFEALSPQTINGFLWTFVKWSDGLLLPYRTEFLTNPVTYNAKFKAHLGTTTPISYSSQRKIARGGFVLPHVLTYESGGDIYYLRSTDGGTTWSQEQLGPATISHQERVSDGSGKYSHPSIESLQDAIVGLEGGSSIQETYVVWEENPVNGTGYRIWARTRNESSQSWGAPILLHEDLSTRPTAALPVVSARAVFWKGTNGILWKEIISPQISASLVPGTDGNSMNPSVEVFGGASGDGTAYVTWEQANTGVHFISGSIHSNGSATWGTIKNVSDNTGSETHKSPVVVRDNSGNACIAWEYRNTSLSQGNIKFRKVDPSGTLSSVSTITIPSGSTHYPSMPSLSDNRNASSNKDDLTLVWYTPADGVQYALYSAGSWIGPYNLTSSGQYASVNVTRNSNETQRMAFVVNTSGPPYAIRTQVLPPPPPPPAPALTSPANGATNVVTAPTLTWSAVGGATSYQIQVSKTSAFAAGDLMFDQSGLTSPSFSVPGLVTNTTYYWQVRGINVSGNGAWSETRSLTTGNTINVNTVWSGQITLPQIAYIYSSATLTIAAGTQLTMSPQRYISVASGNIIVQGTANSKVTFDGVTPGQWYWPYAPIFLQSNSSATVSYADFKNSRTLLTSYFCTGSLTVSNCIFWGQASNMYQATNDGYGIEIYNDPYLDPSNIGAININNNTFTGNGNGYAIVINNVRPSSLTISNNTISNWYNGIYSWSVGGGAISGGSINNCAYGISMIGSQYSSPSSISNVAIQGGNYGIYVTDYDSPTIQNCSIQDAYQCGIYSNGWGNVRFIGNTISKTTQTFGTYGIHARGNSATIDYNNVSSYNTGIYATPDEYMIMGRDSIRWNNIHNTATAIVAYGVPTGIVVQNNIISANRTGTFASYSYGSEKIEYNKFISEGADPNYTTYYGLGVHGNYAPATMTKNEFSGFYGAIYFYTPSNFYTAYSHNNFAANAHDVINNSIYAVPMPYNWWGVCPLGYPGYPYGNLYGYVGNINFDPPLMSPELGTGPGGGNNSWPSCQVYSQANPENGAGEIKLAGESVSEVPKEFFLQQNHPNPFNPETIIQYQLPKESFVSLRIYDMLGREVRRIVDQQQKEGYYSSRWDGKNNAGEIVSSGVYMYRLVASSAIGESPFISTHKMILAR